MTDVTYDQIDVRPMGDTALVHGVTHYTSDGSSESERYTDVWRSQNGRWRAVAAHLTTVAKR